MTKVPPKVPPAFVPLPRRTDRLNRPERLNKARGKGKADQDKHELAVDDAVEEAEAISNLQDVADDLIQHQAEERAEHFVPRDEAGREEKAAHDEAHLDEEHESENGRPPSSLRPSATEKQRGAESKPRAVRDGFEVRREATTPLDPGAPAAAEVNRAEAAAAAAVVSRSPVRPGDTIGLLNSEAREPGTSFEEISGDGGGAGGSSDLDEALAAAVAEAIRLLSAVPGIDRIFAGRDAQELPVVVVTAGPNFTQPSMDAIPEKVHQFPTLLALDFELLPLRRAR